MAKWTRIHRTCASKSKREAIERLKPLDALGWALKYCLRILHPPSRLPSTPCQPPLEHLRLAEDPPFGTRPEVKRRRVYFTLTSPPLILEFSSTLLFILSCSLPPAFHNPLSDTASTMYRWACFPAAGHFDIFILRTWTFDCRGSAIVSRSSESLGWKYVFSFVHFVCIAELLALLARVYVLADAKILKFTVMVFRLNTILLFLHMGEFGWAANFSLTSANIFLALTCFWLVPFKDCTSRKLSSTACFPSFKWS